MNTFLSLGACHKLMGADWKSVVALWVIRKLKHRAASSLMVARSGVLPPTSRAVNVNGPYPWKGLLGEVHRKAGWVESDDSAVDFANTQGNLNTYFCFIY